MIGYFGDIVFESSDTRVLTFSGFTKSTVGRWGKHEVIGQKPANEFIGPDLEVITFTINLNGNFGVMPSKEIEKWVNMVNEGMADVLVIGSRVIGSDKWCVKEVSEAWGVVLNGGVLYSAKVDVTLEEYVESIEVFEPQIAIPEPSAPSAKYGVVTASVLNVRNGPGMNHQIIGKLPRDTRVTITGQEGQWHRINFGEGKGYVSATYIKLI
ncbi:putative phage P2 GpU family protein [Clostridium aceticum]|uniref:Putative phage P2 GpU family protein n=1 Tax=Clostridium aceticum TaxID=84022 RepID=A0A0G3WAU0_9CLOT|nr:phage tail protein [Clostridium aceticum]AKL95022.1 putative phage P2 GpU family protein [Clostridium aceticum]